MVKSNIQRLDYNLLKLMEVLGKEQNTTRAAAKLYISQPAVSKGLNKLREHFNDELFIRQRYGLAPTPFCKTLLKQLPSITRSIEQVLLLGQNFDAKEFEGTMRIAINSALYPVLSQTLLFGLMPLLPKATFEFTKWGLDTEANLRKGKLDLGINYHPLELNDSLMSQVLSHCQFKLGCRTGHPLTQRDSFILKECAQFPLSLLWMPDYTDDENVIERLLKQQGIPHYVQLKADQLSLCLELVRQSDAICPVADLPGLSLPSDLVLLNVNDASFSSDIGLFYVNNAKGTAMTEWLCSNITTLLN